MHHNSEYTTHLHAGYNHPITREWQSNSSIQRNQLVYPIFITDDKNHISEINSIPNQFKIGYLKITEFLNEIINNGLQSVLIFGTYIKSNGLKNQKDNFGTIATSENSPVAHAIKIIKKNFPNLCIITDVCLCAYTDHGHCGVLNKDGKIDNEKSIQRIAEIALFYAKTGAHVLAPSDMMDGRVSAIKKILYNNHLYNEVAIMSYSAKYASSFYGPFRDACDCKMGKTEIISKLYDRSTYQLPIGSSHLGIKAVKRDISEGANFVMVKPGGYYLDVVRDISNFVNVPIAVYQVSGEYSMLYYGAVHKVFDLETAVMESLVAMKRAGASIFISYFTPDILKWIKK